MKHVIAMLLLAGTLVGAVGPVTVSLAQSSPCTSNPSRC